MGPTYCDRDLRMSGSGQDPRGRDRGLRVSDRVAQVATAIRAAATAIMEWDPKLEAPENQRFRKLVVEEQGRSFSNVS